MNHRACYTGFRLALVLSGLVFVSCQPKEITSAKIYMQGNEWQKAIEQLEIAVAENPNNAEARFLLGQAYGNVGRYEEMNTQFVRALDLSREFAQAITAERERHWIDRYNAGIGALDRQEYEKSEQYFRSAILIEPKKHEAHKKLALCYLSMNKLDSALFVYNRLLEKYPNDLDLLASVANLYFSQEQYAETVATLEKILRLQPDHPDALANLAQTYDRMQEVTAAEEAYEKAIAANPQDADLIFLYGVHCFKNENYLKSIELFKRVLELHPDEFEATANIGNAYLSIAENLRTELKQAGNGTRSPEEIQKMKLQVISNYKQAIPFLEKAVDLRPDQPNLWRNLGIAYINTNQPEKGEEAFARSEELQLKSTP